jgi:hypothetical protein
MTGRIRLAPPSLAEEPARDQNGDQTHSAHRKRREPAVSQATIAPPEIKTLADLRRRLGGIPLERIWFHGEVHPRPGGPVA